ncbi:hypothetical protein ACFVAV_22585 [Nocardia sp. NPDC057663]|uniref:hypothetical protein n=1 Tax=Nocardia sp. NPDC057663 TaxID=3346201 RepID=UPI003673114C
MSEQNEGVDPRARWRELPPEPSELIEETTVDTRAADLGVPAVDVTEEFVRKYGL